jgi:hypothetical protein
MTAQETAARFAAFSWYFECRQQATHLEAERFARESWREFLPVASEGWGRLLLRIAGEGGCWKESISVPGGCADRGLAVGSCN